jgi:hypothetical protein
MFSSGMLRRVALVRATRLNIPEDTILNSHRRENLKSYIVFLYWKATHRNMRRLETLRIKSLLVLTRATRRTIPEDDILHSHRRENLKS